MSEELILHELRYGHVGRLTIELLQKRLVLHHAAPSSLRDPAAAARQAFEHPIDFPELHQAFVGDDQVVVAIDVDTPAADVVLAELWKHLKTAGIDAANVRIVQPAVWRSGIHGDPRTRLETAAREQMTLLRHDPTDEASCAYLASTAAGDRVYLSRELTEADVVVTVGPAEFDPVLGVRGTASSLYPGLSDLEALRKTKGQGHEELSPEESRPLRQMVDEIGWLLGLQLSVSVIPGSGETAHQFFVGSSESVLNRSREALDTTWKVVSDERAELVVVTVTADAAGHGWEQVAAAIDAGRRLVERNGRIVVLSELATPPGPGLELLSHAREPRDALKPIQRAQPPDLVAATQMALATDWANVSLMSRLESAVVEDLFCVPLSSPDEVRRLLERDEMTAIIESAQHAFVLCGI